ncbi:MAG: hypothetical protein WAQ22_02435 [Candidatus Saccharimonas sp.]
MSTKERISLRTKRALRHIRPTHLATKFAVSRTVKDFAEKVGLVYFGYVDQKDDDHRLVRGYTVSATHQDNYYSIGSIRGYDVMLVIRNDVVTIPGKNKPRRCHWLIATIDLHTSADLPYFYIGNKTDIETYRSAYKMTTPLRFGVFGQYPQSFVNNYVPYGEPGRAIEIEKFLSPDIAEVIARDFSKISIELDEGTLYLYMECQRPRESVLDMVVSDGLWLAAALDAKAMPQKIVQE